MAPAGVGDHGGVVGAIHTLGRQEVQAPAPCLVGNALPQPAVGRDTAGQIHGPGVLPAGGLEKPVAQDIDDGFLGLETHIGNGLFVERARQRLDHRAHCGLKAAEAEEYIGGLMIMNDMSARRLQMEEMLLNLGPAKGKDFSTVIGPWLVTMDELAAFEIPAKENHTGKNWNLRMQCRVNGKQVSDGNLGDMDWTFAEIIERASYGVSLYPGDVIGSGTVGTGCFLELNGTGKLNDPGYAEQWLQPDDVVEMEIDGLGLLSNTIVAEETDWSILQQKKI